jgi:hypothetical protein
VQVAERDGNRYEVTIEWTNTGNLPVALKQAQLVKIVREDRVELEFDEELTKGYEDAKVKIVEPSTFDKTIKAGYTGAGETQSATFVVELNGISGAEGTLKLLSTRGGYAEQTVTLGDPE